MEHMTSMYSTLAFLKRRGQVLVTDLLFCVHPQVVELSGGSSSSSSSSLLKTRQCFSTWYSMTMQMQRILKRE